MTPLQKNDAVWITMLFLVFPAFPGLESSGEGVFFNIVAKILLCSQYSLPV